MEGNRLGGMSGIVKAERVIRFFGWSVDLSGGLLRGFFLEAVLELRPTA